MNMEGMSYSRMTVAVGSTIAWVSARGNALLL